MNYGEALTYITRMAKKKVKPFRTWKGSKVQDWEVEIELLDVGKNIEVTKAIVDAPITAIAWFAKVETLARCIISINGEAFGSQEQVDAHNKEYNLDKEDAISTLEYKKILIKKWDQVVVNVIETEYNKLQEEHQDLLLGKGKETKKETKEETKEKEAEKVVEDTKKKLDIEESKKDPSVQVRAYVESEDEQK
jgi:hypothetical protein